MVSEASSSLQKTELGLIPKDWTIVKLGELGELKNGVNFSRKDFGEGLPIINVTNLFDGRYASTKGLAEIKTESIPNYQKYQVKDGDILFARSSLVHSGAGQAAMVKEIPKEHTVFSGFIIRFRKNDSAPVDSEFLNYLVRSQIYRVFIPQILAGTAITNINQSILSGLPIILPPLKEQKEIVEIVTCIDSKIELNQRMNQTLEAVGEALFRRWFVDFEFPNQEGKPYKSTGGKMVYTEELNSEIPEGWETKPIDEVADFLNGLALQKFPAREGEEFLPVIKIRELRQGITESTDKANLDLPKEYIVNDGDILFSWSGSLEVVIWGSGNGALNQHLFKVTSKKYPRWFFYYWLLQFLPEYRAIAADKATTMGHIQRRHLSASKVVVPDGTTFEKMDKLLSPIIERRAQLQVESRLLSEIRNCLLPKLMSGKIRVPINKEHLEVT